MKYSISEAAKKVGISASTLRFYDRKGLLPYVNRTESGIRIFDDLDINWLQLLEHLKASGMSIDAIHKYVTWYLQGDETITERQELVHLQREKLKAQMNYLQDAMDMIEFKCWLYDTAAEHNSLAYPRTMPEELIPPDILKTIHKMGGFQPFYLRERYLQNLPQQENSKKAAHSK